MSRYLLELLDHAINLMQERHNSFESLRSLGSNNDFNEISSLVTSFRNFIYSPIFFKWGDQDFLDPALYDAVIQSMERVLRVLTSLYEDYSDCLRNPQSQMILSEQSVSGTQLQISCPPSIGSSRIVDMELDVNEDAQNVDILTVNGKIASGISCSAVKWKLDMISLISSFFSISHVTWDILFELMGKECSQEVYIFATSLVHMLYIPKSIGECYTVWLFCLRFVSRFCTVFVNTPICPLLQKLETWYDSVWSCLRLLGYLLIVPFL